MAINYHLLVNKWYLDQNSDVKSSKITPITHWFKYGRFEGRSLFKPRWYSHLVIKNKELVSELSELNDLTDGDLFQLKTGMTVKNDCSEIKIYRIHKYNRHIRKLLFTLFSLYLTKGKLEVLNLSTKPSRLKIFVKFFRFLYSRNKALFYMRSYDKVKSNLDESVLLTLLNSNLNIYIIGEYPERIAPRIEILLNERQ